MAPLLKISQLIFLGSTVEAPLADASMALRTESGCSGRRLQRAQRGGCSYVEGSMNRLASASEATTLRMLFPGYVEMIMSAEDFHADGTH